MRNLKRALSLGLTAAMISGLMVMGSSAASYADVADTDNVEAIEVLEAVGIMIGDENGNFNPDQNVTRNEMAVVMSNLMEYNVATYKGTSPFTDVPSWAEPYVAACYTNGITAGTSATTYGGSETVTTAQAALMLMKALGYFQYNQDFGTDWQLATVRQGNAIDLFDGVDAGVTQAMTRNDVAQLVLNTLESGMVTATTSGNITVGGVTIATSVEYNYVTSNSGYASSISNSQSTDANSDARQPIVELGEDLYQGDLTKEIDHDAFGRPAAIWSYEDNEIGTYVDDRTETWTTKVSERDLYRSAGTAAVNGYDWTIWKDGDVIDDSVDGYDLNRNNTDRWQNTGNGVLTEMFVDTVAETVDVTIINTYVAEVTRVEADEDEGDYNVTVSFETKPSGSVSREFNSDVEFAVDDVVVVGIADGNIETMALAQVVEGTVNSVKAFDSLTMEGTPYNYNYAYTSNAPIIHYGLVDLDGSGAQNPEAGDEVTIYLDTNGCVVALENAATTAEDYLYVKGTHEMYGDVSARVVYYDGTEEDINVDTLNLNTGVESNNVANDLVNGVYRFERSGNDYELFEANDGDDDANGFEAAAMYVDNNGSGTMDNGDTVGKIENSNARIGTETLATPTNTGYTSRWTANSNTVFVDAYNNVSYTGYQNVPTMSDVQGYVVVEDGDRVADIVFVTNDVEYELDNDSFFLITDLKATESRDDDNNRTWTYTVYVEGEEQELVASNNLNTAADGFNANGKGLYKITRYDSNGYVTTIENVVDWNDIDDLGTNSHALTATADVLILNGDEGVNVPGDRATEQDKNTFDVDDETMFLVAYMKEDNSDIDTVDVLGFNSIRATDTYTTDITGVYVVNVEDKDDDAPTARLVLVIAHSDVEVVGPYTVNVSALPTGIESLTVVDEDGATVRDGDKVDEDMVLTITATPAAGYTADITINGTAQNRASMTHRVTGPVTIGANATRMNVYDGTMDVVVDYSNTGYNDGSTAWTVDSVTYSGDETPTRNEIYQAIIDQVLADRPELSYVGTAASSANDGSVAISFKDDFMTYYVKYNPSGAVAFEGQAASRNELEDRFDGGSTANWYVLPSLEIDQQVTVTDPTTMEVELSGTVVNVLDDANWTDEVVAALNNQYFTGVTDQQSLIDQIKTSWDFSDVTKVGFVTIRANGRNNVSCVVEGTRSSGSDITTADVYTLRWKEYTSADPSNTGKIFTWGSAVGLNVTVDISGLHF